LKINVYQYKKFIPYIEQMKKNQNTGDMN